MAAEFEGSSPADRPQTDPAAADSRTIGPYRLHEVLGEGGMGTVYRAVQTEPVHREVALKIIKPGMDTKEVVARFESERQALAVMDHSSIAKVLDAGATQLGRPYFVMELVRGIPIVEYCDKHKLDTTARLRLFTDVCDAVQHAHQKGVIHRDLKPSNVLVTVQDDRPLPKVIDFGVAKAIRTSLTDATLVTGIGQILGTPAYMSPEQAERSGLDVDTRTDVYSLGVVLYELLSGALPFDRETLQKPDFVVQYLLREKDVPSPSARLGSLADTQETVARNRHTDVRTLRRQLRGDLDWIVMKAMAKDRTRRYATVNDLAADVIRFIAGEPVVARPPSATYRLGKFVRRHRGPIAAGTAVGLALVAGAAASTVGFVRAERSATEAREEAERAQAALGFLDQMLRSADPILGAGPSTTVRELLDGASEDVAGGALADQPLVEATVRRSIGGTYMLLGVHERAGEHLEAALTLLEASPGASALERVTVLDELGQLRRREADLVAAERLYRRALALADSTGLTSDGAHGEELVNDVRNDLALVLREADRIDEAGEILEQLVASERRLLGPDDLDLATTLNNLALVRRSQGDLDGAIALFRETLGVLRAALGESHMYIAAVVESIGSLEAVRGRYDAADSLMTLALDMRREIVGERHPDVVNSLNSLGLLHAEAGDLDRARTYLTEGLDMSIELLGEGHSRTALLYNSLGILALREEDAAAAETAFRRAVAIREEALGVRHRSTLNSQANLAAALRLGGNASAAEAIARSVVAAQDEVGLDDPTLSGSARRIWGTALSDLGRHEEAETALLGAYEIQEPALGAEHQQTQSTVTALVELYERWGRTDDLATWRGRLAAGGR